MLRLLWVHHRAVGIHVSTLLRSQVECPECGELVASIHRHDFRACPCGKTCIDGGRDYMRILTNYEWQNRSISVEEDLTLEEASHCLAVLNALCKITAHDKAHMPLSMIEGSLVANVIWEARGRRGLPDDHKPPGLRASTRKWLALLVRNGLVERKALSRGRRPRYGWRPKVRLAEHPEVP